MPGYSLYCFDDEGGFGKLYDIPARNDREALSLARALKMTVRCELRDDGRVVATLEPTEAGRD
jgi:hypothetical protein